jgi:UDP-GlcNAc:undecaprenyl-phosphate GlcNAc-1-phosphate transferase
VAAAVVLWHFDLGWTFLDSDLERLILTSAWIVGFTNAFNLMDNMDGAAGTVAAVCSAGIAAQALVVGDAGEVALIALALAGGCLGFLPHNLRRKAPARIFLGDGGSLPIGFIVAALAMNIPGYDALGWPVLLVAALLLGVPVLDTLLVVVSRTRRGVSIVTAGRDHLTHRLRARLPSPVAVAAALAVAQAAVVLVTIGAARIGRTSIIVVATACLALGAAIVVLLDSPAWTAAGRRLAGYEARDESDA